MKLDNLEIFVTKNKNPGKGGRYFIFVKLTTTCGIIGYGEVYAGSVAPQSMKSIISDVFERHMYNENPYNIEIMFRRAYSSGFSQRPDPTIIGAFSGLEIACWDILGKSLNQPIHNLLGGKVRKSLRSYTYLYPKISQDSNEFYTSAALSSEAAAKAVKMGFTALKFDPAGPYTIFGGHQPTLKDLNSSKSFGSTIRETIGERADLLFGTHGQFTPSGAIRLAQSLERFNPLWFEEPIPPEAQEICKQSLKIQRYQLQLEKDLQQNTNFQKYYDLEQPQFSSLLLVELAVFGKLKKFQQLQKFLEPS